MKKKYFAGMLVALAVLLSFLSISYAQSIHGQYKGHPIAKLVVDGKELELDVPAIITDGRTLVPARAVAEAWGPRSNGIPPRIPSASQAAQPKTLQDPRQRFWKPR